MPQIKSILGHASVKTAGRKRTCYRHRSGKAAHDIVKGEACLVIHGADGSDHGYCQSAAAEMLYKAEHDLAVLKAGLGL